VPWNTEFGSEGFDKTPPEPLTMVHSPVPTSGVLPARLTGPHDGGESAPALATVGASSNVIATSSWVAPHDDVIVQRSTYDSPALPLNTLAGSVSSANDPPAPLMILHCPVPIAGLTAARVASVPQTV